MIENDPASGEGRKLTVAMLTNLFHPVATGSATQTRGLSRALVASGHRVVVITPHLDPNSPAHEIIDGFDVYRIPAIHLPRMAISLNFPWLNWTFWPRNLRRIQDILRQHKVDVLHLHNHMFDMAFSAVWLRWRLRLPLVLTMHTIIRHSIDAFNLLLYPADRWFLRHMVVRHADRIVCPDVNIQAYLSDAFRRDDGVLVPYGIELPKHPGQLAKDEIVSQFNLKGRRVILSLGHVHALRNRLDLIAAMPKVRARFPNVMLLIVGTVGDQRPVELVKRLGLEETVIFAGSQPHGSIPVFHEIAELEAMWLDQADEGMNSLGVACMEAMLAGKPVLTVSNIDTFGSGVLAHKRDVVIVKPRDPQQLAETINELLASPEATARIGLAAHELAAERFAWPKIASRTAEVYEQLAAPSRLNTANAVVEPALART